MEQNKKKRVGKPSELSDAQHARMDRANLALDFYALLCNDEVREYDPGEKRNINRVKQALQQSFNLVDQIVSGNPSYLDALQRRFRTSRDLYARYV